MKSNFPTCLGIFVSSESKKQICCLKLIIPRCGEPILHLYTEFSEGSIKLTHCEVCGGTDGYIEKEMVLVVIDLLLHRDQVLALLIIDRLSFY